MTDLKTTAEELVTLKDGFKALIQGEDTANINIEGVPVPSIKKQVKEKVDEHLLNVDIRSNILFDPFNEYISKDTNFGGWDWLSATQFTIETDSLNNPFQTPSLRNPDGGQIDRRWDYTTLGLIEGDDLTVRVSCFFNDASGRVSAYLRSEDDSVLVSGFKDCVSGLNDVTIQLVVPAGSVHRLMIRCEHATALFEVFGYFAARGVGDPQMNRTAIPQKYITTTAEYEQHVSDAIETLYTDNLVPDPFHRMLANGVDSQNGYPTVNRTLELETIIGNPFSSKALKLPAGKGFVDRNIAFSSLGLSVGDTLTARIGVFANQKLAIGAYFRAADNTVVGPIGSNARVFSNEYYELDQTHTITQEIYDNAEYLQIRMTPDGGVATTDIYICAWAAYKNKKPSAINSQDQASAFDLIDQISALDTDILLPSVYAVLTGSGQESNIYFDYAVRLLGLNTIDVSASKGTQLDECWRLNPIDVDDVQNGDAFNVTLALKKGTGVVKSSTTTINVVDPVDTSAIRLMAIGDSITRNGVYVKHVQTVLPNCKAVGIRQYSGEDFAREGRGGWQLENYCSRFGHLTSGDSPFLFPEGVAGSLYFGNTSQWLSIINDASSYNHDGFQRIAKDWDETGVYQYDAVTGRRLSPPEGAVMYDPVAGEYIQYTLGAWSVMAQQPASVEFSFSKYMQRFSAAHQDGAPTHVSIMSGANDFYYDEGGISDSEWEAYLARLNTILNSINEYSADIKRIICLPIGGAGQDGAGKYKGSGPSSHQFNTNMQILARRLLDEFDDQTSRDAGIFIAPLLLSLDPIAGFPSSTYSRNKYATDISVVRQTDQLHPRDEGHYQMGDCLAATVQWCRV